MNTDNNTDVSVRVKDSDGKVIEEENAQELLVDWDIVSNVLTISVETHNGIISIARVRR